MYLWSETREWNMAEKI